MHTAYTASFANELLVERQDTMPLMSWSRVRLCQPAFQILRNPMAYLGQMARELMACLGFNGRKANPFAGMWRSSAHLPTTCSLQPPPPVLLPSWPQGREIQRTGRPVYLPAHCCGVSWPHELGGPQVPGRPRSEDFACVWRRQGNHVFVSTHFCFVISFQFCFVAQ